MMNSERMYNDDFTGTFCWENDPEDCWNENSFSSFLTVLNPKISNFEKQGERDFL